MKQTHRLTEQICGYQVRVCGGGCGRGVNWEFESGRCKLLHIEWINKKVQLYSIGNYSQHPVINHSEEE